MKSNSMDHKHFTVMCFVILFGAAISVAESGDISNKSSSSQSTHPNSSYPDTWSVKWVYIIHLSKDHPKHTAQAAYDGTIAFIFFGEGAQHMSSERHILVMTTKNPHSTSFTQIRDAFSLGLRAYPFAEYFAKFNNEPYVEHRNIIRQISHSSPISYWGSPINNGKFDHADGKTGYILSRESAERLHECHNNQHDEDYAVGWCLHQAGITLASPRRLLKFEMIIWNTPIEGIMAFFSFNWGRDV